MGHAAAALAHVALLQALWCGGALVLCGLAAWQPELVAPWQRLLGHAADVGVLLLYTAALLTLLLAHFATAVTRSSKSKCVVIMYVTLAVLSSMSVCGVAAWAALEVARFLDAAPALSLLSADPERRRILHPLLPLLAPDLTKHLPEEPVSVAACLLWIAVAMWPVLQLLGAALAVCTWSQHRDRQHTPSLSRSSSMYYEKQVSNPAQHKAPLHETAPWL